MRRILATLFIAFITGLNTAPATLVDWSALAWSPGTLSNSYDVEPTNPGNDVTFTVSGDTAQLQTSLAAPNPQTPAITGALQGGFSPAHVNLELAVNLTNNAQAVTVMINFSNAYANGVAYVSFKIFDIDFANSSGNTYQDVIRSITATSTTGATLAPTITVNPNVTLTGAGTSQVLTGNTSTIDTGVGSGAANATITFDTTNIRTVTFTYGSSNAFADPTYQHIGLDNLYFEIVPEINPTWVTLSVCGGLVFGSTLHRRSKIRRATKKFGH